MTFEASQTAVLHQFLFDTVHYQYLMNRKKMNKYSKKEGFLKEGSLKEGSFKEASVKEPSQEASFLKKKRG